MLSLPRYSLTDAAPVATQTPADFLTPPNTPQSNFHKQITRLSNVDQPFNSAVRIERAMLSEPASEWFFRGGTHNIGFNTPNIFPPNAPRHSTTIACYPAVSPTSTMTPLQNETAFVGLGKVAQVLRWVSSVALITVQNEPPKNEDSPELNKSGKPMIYKTGEPRYQLFFKNGHVTFDNTGIPLRESNQFVYGKPQKNEKYTPEIQAAVLGGRLILGSNADNDQDIPHKIYALLSPNNHQNYHNAVKDMTNVIDREKRFSRTLNDENIRALEQKLRHLNKLHDFVNQPGNFDQMVRTAISECNEDIQEAQLTENMLRQIYSALKKDGHIQMAAKPTDKNGKPAEGMVHAEQRVIEYVQRHQVEEYKKAIALVDHEKNPSSPLPLIIAGTKPPCVYCDTTERARHEAATSTNNASSMFTIVRFEDQANNAGYGVGKLFPGKMANPHPIIAKSIDNVLTPPQNSNDLTSFKASTPSAHESYKVHKDSPQKPSSNPALQNTPQTPIQISSWSRRLF